MYLGLESWTTKKGKACRDKFFFTWRRWSSRTWERCDSDFLTKRFSVNKSFLWLFSLECGIFSPPPPLVSSAGRNVLPTWCSFTKLLHGGRQLLLADFLVFLSLCLRPESLPGQGPAEEVDEDVAQSLHVVSPGLFCNGEKLWYFDISDWSTRARSFTKCCMKGITAPTRGLRMPWAVYLTCGEAGTSSGS